MAQRPFVHPVEPGRPFVAEPTPASESQETFARHADDGRGQRRRRQRLGELFHRRDHAVELVGTPRLSGMAAVHVLEEEQHPPAGSLVELTLRDTAMVAMRRFPGWGAHPWIPAFAGMTVVQGSLVVGPQQARRRGRVGQAGRYADLAAVERRRVGVGLGPDGLGEDAAAVVRGQPRRHSGREAGGLRYSADYFAAEPAFDLAPDAPGQVRPVQPGAPVGRGLSLLY